MTRSKYPTVLGIWDLRVVPLSLGRLLRLVADLHAQAMTSQGQVAGLCVIGDELHPLPVSGVPLSHDSVAILDNETCERSPFLSGLLSLEGMDRIYQSDSLPAFKEFAYERWHSPVLWPSPDNLDELGRLDFWYGQTTLLKRVFRETGRFNQISVKAGPRQWALDFFEARVAPSLPVVVHLTNDQGEEPHSNADMDEWHAFLKDCASRHDVRFVLVGTQEIDDRIRKLPNVLVSQDLGNTLLQELALVQTAYLFIGMASGPYNMAMLGGVPHFIFKNPDDDVEEMVEQLGNSIRHPFSTPHQKVFREFETRTRLMEEFDELVAQIDRSAWEARLARMQGVQL